MIQYCNTYRVLELFFKQPTRKFHKREISRMLKLGLPSVSSHLEKLEKNGLIMKDKEGIYETYKASINDEFKTQKLAYNLVSLYDSGLVSFLTKEYTPDCIILFGSASHGEDIEESDIDIFMISGKKDLSLSGFEKKLGRKINLQTVDNFSSLSKELRNNIINGVKLYGYLEVFI